MTAIPPLIWIQVGRSQWFSEGGRYVILHSVLPELGEATEIYTVRKRDPASARANPSTLGYHLAECYTLRAAQQEADRDNWSDAQGKARHVPETYPALALSRFYWPISSGITLAGLAIVRRDGKLYVQVVGMSRGDDPGQFPADHYRPGIYAEIELTPELLAKPTPGEPDYSD